jgi:serine/threonine protein kinase
MNNENKKEYESNNDNTEARFYDKPNYNEKITLSRLIPIESKGHRLIIGKGAFSNVYLYKDIISQEKYAVKIMEKDFILKNLETLEIINKEIEIQSRINHPNIIRLYNIYENSNTIYMIMEYLNNGNLFSLIRRKKGLIEIEAYKYFSQIVNAIKFLHKNNIIHRDIKPENILLDNKYNCKLCDFGWSVILKDNSSRNTFCGTIEYMAPEIINNEQYDKSIDIWSLGVLLFEMIHGFNPFENNKKNINLLFDNIKHKNLKFQENISDECKDLIQKM